MSWTLVWFFSVKWRSPYHRKESCVFLKYKSKQADLNVQNVNKLAQKHYVQILTVLCFANCQYSIILKLHSYIYLHAIHIRLRNIIYFWTLLYLSQSVIMFAIVCVYFCWYFIQGDVRSSARSEILSKRRRAVVESRTNSSCWYRGKADGYSVSSLWLWLRWA